MSKLKRKIKPLVIWIMRNTFIFRSTYETIGIGCPVNYKYFFFQKVLGFNRFVPWPVHFTSSVTGYKYIKIGVNTAPGASIGNYIFASPDARIYIGDYTVIASGVCIAGFNHDVNDISRYTTRGGISIGRYCWIGANAVVLSGVTLGDHTVVAAGAVVKDEFPEGYCVLAGNPAQIVKRLEPEKITEYQHPYKYHGYKRLGQKV